MKLAKISRPVQYALGAIAAAPAFYWMIKYTGPYRTLMELEFERLGWASQKLTVLAIAAVLYAPLHLIAALRTDERVQDPAQPEPVHVPESARTSAMIAAASTAVLLAAAGWWFALSVRAGDLRHVTVDDFAHGRVAEPAYVEVDGEPLEGAVKLTKGTSEAYYIPVAGASLVVESPSKMKPLADGRVRARGVARRGVLDGEVEALLRKDNASIGESPWVIQTGQNPAEGKRDSTIFAGISLLIGGGIFAMRRRAARRGDI